MDVDDEKAMKLKSQLQEKIPSIKKAIATLQKEDLNSDRMYKMIEKDYMIVIWPEGQIEKDINEMIINGKTKDQVQKIISDNTYSGLSAITQINSYKRC